MFQKAKYFYKVLTLVLLCVCSRCLIYKVHAALQRAFILPKLEPFVKNFFRLHRSFSKPLRLVLDAAALADSLFRVPHSFASVKHLFSLFRTFFIRSTNFRSSSRSHKNAAASWTARLYYHAISWLSSFIFSHPQTFQWD